MKHKRSAALLSLLLVLLLVPSRAYADARFGYVGLFDGVQCHNNYADEGDIGSRENYLVYAPDKYAAAVMALGGDVNSLTSEQKLKLSDSNYGGAFYTFVQGFSELEGGSLPDYVPAYIAATLMIYYSPIGGGVSYLTQSEMYTTSVSTQVYDAAKAAYLAVINGEDMGGGGTAVGDGLPATILLDTPYGLNSTDGSNWNNMIPVTRGSVRMTFDRPDKINSFLRSTGCQYFYAFATPCFWRNGYNGWSWNAQYHLFASPTKVNFSFETPSSGVPYLSIVATSDSTLYYRNGGNEEYDCIASGAASAGGSFLIGNWDLSNVGTSKTVTGSFTSCYSNGVVVLPDPAGDWPSDSGVHVPVAPVVPDPDVQPSVSGPVVVAPSVTWPDIDITINDNTPEGTTPEDYTPILEAINASINSLRSDLLTEFDAVLDSIRNIYSYLLTLDNVLENHCVHLRNQIIASTNHLENYLQSLFDWLGQQLDFSFDDTNIVIWLKRIYSRLGGGDTYKPNPISDDDGFLDWLYELWQNFLIDLLSVLPDSLGGLVETISQLTHYFPFSIPWDLFALLALFEHEPVIPVFDIPYPFASGEDGQIMLHIDFTGWDASVQMIRPVFVVGFCFQLALITRDLLSGLDMSKGGI